MGSSLPVRSPGSPNRVGKTLPSLPREASSALPTLRHPPSSADHRCETSLSSEVSTASPCALGQGKEEAGLRPLSP